MGVNWIVLSRPLAAGPQRVSGAQTQLFLWRGGSLFTASGLSKDSTWGEGRRDDLVLFGKQEPKKSKEQEERRKSTRVGGIA